MATKASTLLRAAARKAASLASTAASRAALQSAREASLASRAAAAAASRAARAADEAANAARATRSAQNTKSCSKPNRFPTYFDYQHLPDDCKTPTAKDLESDEAVWALYERWCKAFNKKRDHAGMMFRFKIFRHTAESVYRWNTDVPADPKKAAIWLKKRRKAELLLSEGKDVSHFDERHLPAILGPCSDGDDPFLSEWDYELLKDLEERDARRAPKDVTADDA